MVNFDKFDNFDQLDAKKSLISSWYYHRYPDVPSLLKYLEKQDKNLILYENQSESITPSLEMKQPV